MGNKTEGRPAGNNTAMREVLESVVKYLGDIVPTQREIGLVKSARAALAKPARNCDVGTADEQAERFENFCLQHIGCAEETGGRHCVGCPLEKASRHITQKCELYWTQMPYDKEESNE